jgi:hypothetical protein
MPIRLLLAAHNARDRDPGVQQIVVLTFAFMIASGTCGQADHRESKQYYFFHYASPLLNASALYKEKSLFSIKKYRRHCEPKA